MKVYLIRHGQTSANEEHRYCGRTDLPLSSSGIRQLQAIKSSSSFPSVDQVYHTGLLRTRETAAILFPDAPMQAMPMLREFDFGDFELHTYEELKDNPDYVRWISQIDHEPCPNGESADQFKRRVLDGWQTILARENAGLELACRWVDSPVERPMDSPVDNRRIAIVSHGGVIATLMDHFYPGERHFYLWQPACGAGYCLEVLKDQVTASAGICASPAAGSH